MRKYFFAFLMIFSGIALLIFVYTQNNRTSYPETIFKEESKLFDQSFTDFIGEIENDIQLIRSNFQKNYIKDTANTQKYFLQFIAENPYLLTVGFGQNEYKIGTHRDGKSIVYALDSTENRDIVRWQRFEKGKFISSWEESFEGSINETSWYQDLSKNFNEIQWFFNSNFNENEDYQLFYAGYSYEADGVKSIILFRFSRQILSKKFNIFSKYKDINLLIETTKKKTMDLSSKSINSFREVENLDARSDSLMIQSMDHFKKFDQAKSGVFNFNYKDEIYWNSFKRFPAKTGILHYMLTIPDSEIKNPLTTSINKNVIWIALFIILIGILILLIKKRNFYRYSSGKLPTVEDLLKDDESRYLEFKSSLRYDYIQEKYNPILENVIFKTLSAFGNTDGGILLIGVSDDKKILGLENDFNTLKKSNADYYEVHLRNNLHQLMGVRYVSKYIRMEFEKFENKKIVCKIKVFPAKEPLYLKIKNKNGLLEEKFYVRSGNSSQEIKSIAEINDYINTRFKK